MSKLCYNILMNETLSSSPESTKNSKKSPWDILTKLPSFEEHLENIKNKKTASSDINSRIDDYIASQQPIRQKQSQEAYIDGLIGPVLNNATQKLANNVQNIMAIDEEIKQNQYDHDHDLNFQYGIQRGLERHKEVIQGERTQEIIERDLNDRLTKIDDLENLADIEGTGITSSEIEYNKDKVKVLNLENVPFTMLTHSIDFKQTDMHQVQGQGTSNALRALPNIWLDRQDSAVVTGTSSSGNYNARSNVICTSYSNTDNPNSKPVGGDIIYGFDHVDANSILKLSDRDGNTPPILDYRNNFPNQNRLNFFDEVINGASHGSYNEVTIRRYDETGKPKVPDYLVTYNGHISEDAKNHANTFKIPIINIIKNDYS